VVVVLHVQKIWLETEIGLEMLCDFTNEKLEGELLDVNFGCDGFHEE
jgi:hypothetical protein